jgi:hypothetical protein
MAVAESPWLVILRIILRAFLRAILRIAPLLPNWPPVALSFEWACFNLGGSSALLVMATGQLPLDAIGKSG